MWDFLIGCLVIVSLLGTIFTAATLIQACRDYRFLKAQGINGVIKTMTRAHQRHEILRLVKHSLVILGVAVGRINFELFLNTAVFMLIVVAGLMMINSMLDLLNRSRVMAELKAREPAED